jgi:hypothetical protein
MKRIINLAVVGLLAAAGAQGASLVGYGPSITTEEGYVTAAGHTVTLWDDATWQAADASDFAAFDAILVGQNNCGDFTLPDGIWANSSLWGPLVTGNILMHSHDDHFSDEVRGSSDNRYDLVIARCADFAGSGNGLGLCISIQCASIPSLQGGTATFTIPGIGDFEVDDFSGDDIDVVNPGHPAMAGITSEDLDCWGNSTHAHIQAYPADFELLAVDTGLGCPGKPTGGGGEAPQGEGGQGPVTIARGSSASVLEVPALTPSGIALLALALAGAAFLVLRQR